MKQKVILIGIDGMDSWLVEKFIDDMPNFMKIKAQSPKFKFKSIFPPDSTPAWASIYTGLNPAQHGIINFVNPADKEGGVIRKEAVDSDFKGRTFWDIAGNSGKKSCIVLPFSIFPGWEINGSMITRIHCPAPSDYPLSAFPESLIKKYNPSSKKLNTFEGFYSLTEKDLKKMANEYEIRAYAEGDLAVKMLQEENWDLFFVYFSSLDGIEHYFWNRCDENHPNYNRNNRFKNVIKHFYILLDKMVGNILNVVDDDIPLIVLSDHGHGSRPTTLFNVNEILRESGMLIPSEKSKRAANPFYKTKWFKKQLISYINRFGVGNMGMRIAKKFPIWKKVLASPLSIDWNRTMAYVTDLSAIKSYSYGGIRINRDVVKPDQIDDVIDNIIKVLIDVEDPRTSKKIVKYAYRREYLYTGEFIGSYPEIVLELDDHYGLGWEINESLFDYDSNQNIQPGSHKKNSPVLFSMNVIADTSLEITPIDVTPTILRLLGVHGDFNLDGRSFAE